MTLKMVTPAPYLELTDMLKRGGLPHKCDAHQMARIYTCRAQSWGYLNEVNVMVAAAGLYPTVNGQIEAWFAAYPQAASEMLSFIRLAQLTLQMVEQYETKDIICYIACGHRPGQRIAKALNFVFEFAEHGFEIWVRRNLHV